ncbi:MAG: hypothetical protein QXW40_06240 [Thermofilum sp.]
MVGLEEFVAEKTIELYLARLLSEMAGRLTGKQVVSAHKCVVGKLCRGKSGWEALECVVDNMDRLYRMVREVGYEKAMEEIGCGELIPR